MQIKQIRIELSRGFYIYVGSAFGSGGLSSRIHRHLRRRKKNHWHIDQVTMNEYCNFHGVAAFLNEKSECIISNYLHNLESIIPVQGFGSTDCKNSCKSHFFKLDKL
ncbi:MAG: GIY-YIG nuclease family protein [Candidatus Heimdallarchaeaceae archaeon]